MGKVIRSEGSSGGISAKVVKLDVDAWTSTLNAPRGKEEDLPAGWYTFEQLYATVPALGKLSPKSARQRLANSVAAGALEMKKCRRLVSCKTGRKIYSVNAFRLVPGRGML